MPFILTRTYDTRQPHCLKGFRQWFKTYPLWNDTRAGYLTPKAHQNHLKSFRRYAFKARRGSGSEETGREPTLFNVPSDAAGNPRAWRVVRIRKFARGHFHA